MSLFLKLIAVFKVAVPLPDFKDAEAIQAWLTGLSGPLADLIATLANQLLTTGSAIIDLPDGSGVTFLRAPDGSVTMSQSDQGKLCAAAAESAAPQADGKWLNLFKELLPVILQLLALFGVLKPAPAPTA